MPRFHCFAAPRSRGAAFLLPIPKGGAHIKTKRIEAILAVFLLVINSVVVFCFASQLNKKAAEERSSREEPPIPMPEIQCEDERYNIPATKYATFYDERIPLDNMMQLEVCYASELAGIDPHLAFAVIWQETDFRNVEGDGGDSIGYMQIQPKWHAERMERLGCTDLSVPYQNFLVGCDFLGELLENHSLENALTYYNAGYFGCNEYALQVIGKYNILMNGGDVR